MCVCVCFHCVIRFLGWFEISVLVMIFVMFFDLCFCIFCVVLGVFFCVFFSD